MSDRIPDPAGWNRIKELEERLHEMTEEKTLQNDLQAFRNTVMELLRAVGLVAVVERLNEHLKKHPLTEALEWHWGPTTKNFDPGRRWCYDCGGEVYSLEDELICSNCNRHTTS